MATQLRNDKRALRDALKDRIQKIEERVARIEASLPADRVIVLREVSREEAKDDIRQLFSTGRTLHYSDIAGQLQLDLELVVDICNELRSQGEIAVDAGIP